MRAKHKNMSPPSAAPNDIWSWPERPQTFADISFASTSINHVEFPDDIGPVAYHANRAAMASNGVAELAELEELEVRNQRTTAYPGISCAAGPMSPEYADGPQCDVTAMQERAHGITAYRSNGTSLLPQFNSERSLSCANMEKEGVGMGAPDPALAVRASGEPPIGYAPHVYSYPQFGPRAASASTSGKMGLVRTQVQKKGGAVSSGRKRVKTGIPFKYIPGRAFNSVRGALYDMQHINELPPAQSGAPPGNVTSFVFTRDGRAPYLIIMVTVILVLVATVTTVRSLTKQNS